MIFLLRKHIAFIFLFLLFTPTLIRSSHAIFENHEHISCTSKTDQHLHQLENDCSDLHLQLETFYFNLDTNFELSSKDYYSNKPVEKTQQVKSVFFLHKSSRGPPRL